MMGDPRGTKIWIGNVEGVDERDLKDEFERHGRLSKLWVARNPPGFAFAWYEDPRDADEAIRATDGRRLGDKTIRTELSNQRRGGDSRGGGGRYGDRGGDDRRRAPPRTGFKVKMLGLPEGTRWTDLKDFARKVGDVIFADVYGDEGVAEFSNRGDMENAVRELDGTDFMERKIRVEMMDESDRYARQESRSPPRGRYRSASPPRRGGRYSRSRSPPPRRRSPSPRGRGGGRYSRSRSRSFPRERER